MPPTKLTKKINRSLLLSGHYIVVNCKEKSFQHFSGVKELKQYFEDQFVGQDQSDPKLLMEELKNYIVFRGIMSPIKFKYKNDVSFLVKPELESSQTKEK